MEGLSDGAADMEIIGCVVGSVVGCIVGLIVRSIVGLI